MKVLGEAVPSGSLGSGLPLGELRASLEGKPRLEFDHTAREAAINRFC